VNVRRLTPLILLLAVSLSSLGAACDAQRSSEPAAPSTSASAVSAKDTASKDAPAAPKSPDAPDATDAAKPKGFETLGQSCRLDKMCSGFLRCMGGTCIVPPAVTGTPNDDTATAVFRQDRAKGSPEVFRFAIEVADTNEERMRGLMYRLDMKADWGMLFIYPASGMRSFWMKNTYLPLDMPFIDQSGRIVNILANVEPLTLEPRPSTGPARYVLELNAGMAKARRLEPGMYMSLEGWPKPEDLPRP